MATVVSVSRSARHGFSKEPVREIRLLAGLGVEGDAHCGALVKHRYKVRQDPTQPNLCQVHLLAEELLEELAGRGFLVAAGEMGENVTTSGIELLELPTGARLKIGEEAVVEVTGLREPCVQMDKFQKGLMKAVIGRKDDGRVQMRSGIMGIVIAGGVVRVGDGIEVELPVGPFRELVCV